VYDIVKLCIKNLKNIEVEDISKIKSLHEANKLSLNISKAKKHLYWKPRLSIDKTIDLTLEWYKKYKFEDVYELCTKQINYYVSLI
jgi:CDP-glucose 4,6-dehydratase